MVWGGAYGGSNRTSGDVAITGSHDLSARTVGLAGGFDYRLTPETVVGLAFAGGGTNWSLSLTQSWAQRVWLELMRSKFLNFFYKFIRKVKLGENIYSPPFITTKPLNATLLFVPAAGLSHSEGSF